MDEFAWRMARAVYPFLAGVAAIGLFLNSVLLLATIRTKSLRSTTNLLIGCCAVFDIMHETGYFVQFPILFTDYYIDSFYCSFLQLLPAMGRAAGAVCVLCTGVDRMLCIVAVVVYKRMRKAYFMMCHLLAISLFCSWTVYLMVGYYAPKQQICSMPAPFHGESLGLWSNTITIVNIFSAFIYFITWQAVKRRQVSQYKTKIFHSIAVVMAVEVTGWFISSILIDLSKIYVVQERRPPFHYVACLFVNSGIAVKTIVYYSISGEYRRAIRSVLSLSATSEVSGTHMQASWATSLYPRDVPLAPTMIREVVPLPSKRPVYQKRIRPVYNKSVVVI
ncbi:hypothetical protein PRIPAC_78207 [Pristionchus pacificus]|uniref:G protein-coupled receptor n=1 Tax=Pristionchus pacificus TaxID=54126 RepID=A0A2A6CL07_PRIPA|nr:hypothetical protein PRIPAC_78207 [Pristionchus pacificus]|eukprot:PDM78915.1 G protein-coupled receptor [Pristionchus pacificus]